MSVETMSRRISTIEQSWKNADQPVRAEYVEELTQISTGLRAVTGVEAERADWLSRRVNRMVRTIDAAG